MPDIVVCGTSSDNSGASVTDNISAWFYDYRAELRGLLPS